MNRITSYNVCYTKLLRARYQDGSQGSPLKQMPFDLAARYNNDPKTYDQGGIKIPIPDGYWIDLTELALDQSWERLPSLDNCRITSYNVCYTKLLRIFITYSTFLLIVRIYIVYYAIVFSMLIVAGFKIKNKISGYYLKGAFFFVLGGLTAFLGAINVIDFNLSYLEIGLLGQFFFFTIGLQYKIQQEREKAP